VTPELEAIKALTSEVRALRDEVAELRERHHVHARTHGDPGGSGEKVDAQAVAEALGVSRQWVYGNAARLGGERLTPTGEGKRPRWRFDLDVARAALAGRQVEADEPVTSPPRRRRRPAAPVELLPIAGKDAA
jgi:hypothetical protein